jgi:hypothetical protein
MIFNRQMGIKNLQMPGNIGSDHYIFQIRNRYDSRTKKLSNMLYNDELKSSSSSMKPQYIFLDEKLNKKNFIHLPYRRMWNDNNNHDKLKRVSIGLNIRRKPGVKGFEFRIMDHLPEKELENLLKIVYLIACMSYEVVGKKNQNLDKLVLAASNKSWNDMIVSALFDGYKANISTEYIKFLEGQFGLSGLYALNTRETMRADLVLETLVNACWTQVSKNKKNGLWMILGNAKTKPLVVSKNKEILDKLV